MELPARRAVPVLPARRVRVGASILGGFLFLSDVLMLFLAILLTDFLVVSFGPGIPDFDRHASAAVLTGLVFILMQWAQGAHSLAATGRFRQLYWWCASDLALASLIALSLAFAFKVSAEFSRLWMGCFGLIALLLLLLSRVLLQITSIWMASRGMIGSRVAIYGSNALAARFVERLQAMHTGFNTLVGVIDERGTRVSEKVHDLPLLGDLDHLIAMARRNEVDKLIICLPNDLPRRIGTIISRLEEVAIDVALAPTALMLDAPLGSVQRIGGLPVFGLWERPMRDWPAVVKWIEDKVVAVSAVILLSPVLIATALAVKLTSRGPVLFRQPRYGFNNEVINVMKFRSMYVDRQDISGSQRTVKDDPRITPIGRFIRRTSIDELPQLFNVLAGDMSIVGPRPHAVAMKVGTLFYQDAVRGYAARHRVKPGITGLAQVNGLRGEINSIERARKRVDFDVEYINTWSLALDLRIIAQTAIKLFFDKQAY